MRAALRATDPTLGLFEVDTAEGALEGSLRQRRFVLALLGGFAENLLFGVGARDPLTLATVAAGLLLTAFAASALPALRATRVDLRLGVPSRAPRFHFP